MRSPSIEYLHTKIEKHIKLVGSYTENKHLEFIIKSCRLKPYSHIFEEQNNKTVLYRWWFDEYRNCLEILKNKKVEIIYNDLRLDKNKIISTDLYYGLSLDKVVKMSKLLYLCAGKDEDLFQPCYLLTLLGMDDYLRSYLYWFGEWQQVSPLLMGFNHLKLLSNNMNIKHFINPTKFKKLPIPCVSGQTYLSCLPAHPNFLTIIKKQYELLLPIFG